VVRALIGVDLTVAKGEFVAVMGASGSGKSTLLHLLAGLTTPSEGTVEIEGRDLGKMRDRELTLFRRRRIGIVFQAYNLIPTLDVEQNICLPLLADGRRREAKSRLEPILATLDLADRRKHRPDQLSGGEQQRVAIGRAMITDPAIVLADEPTGNLDSAAGRHVCEILREACDARGRTIVMVTHEPSVAVFTRRVVVLKDGRCVGSFETDRFDHADELAAEYQAMSSAEAAGAEV